MNQLMIKNKNRQLIQQKYIDSLISRMDFMQIKYLLKDYLNDEIQNYSNEDLLDEIMARGDNYVGDVFDCTNNHTKEEEMVLS
jgi:hypothetical protein